MCWVAVQKSLITGKKSLVACQMCVYMCKCMCVCVCVCVCVYNDIDMHAAPDMPASHHGACLLLLGVCVCVCVCVCVLM